MKIETSITEYRIEQIYTEYRVRLYLDVVDVEIENSKDPIFIEIEDEIHDWCGDNGFCCTTYYDQLREKILVDIHEPENTIEYVISFIQHWASNDATYMLESITKLLTNP